MLCRLLVFLLQCLVLLAIHIYSILFLYTPHLQIAHLNILANLSLHSIYGSLHYQHLVFIRGYFVSLLSLLSFETVVLFLQDLVIQMSLFGVSLKDGLLAVLLIESLDLL